MATYSIWYMRPEWFRQGIMGAEPDPKNLEATHVLLKEVEFEDEGPVLVPGARVPIPDAFERIFHDMQGEHWSPAGEANPLIRAKGLEHTSMSVGDVIVAPDGRVCLVARLGFLFFNPLVGHEPVVEFADLGGKA